MDMEEGVIPKACAIILSKCVSPEVMIFGMFLNRLVQAHKLLRTITAEATRHHNTKK